jgi:small subunit ribosomal protein S20
MKELVLGRLFRYQHIFINYLGGLALANIVSAKKRARQSLVRRDRNQQLKSGVRTLEKRVRTAIAAKDKDSALTLLKNYTSAIGKAAQKGKYHPKTASRKVSRLTLFLNKMTG